MMYPNTEVKNCSSLHAKVVIGQHSCLVGSANFSDSALGFRKPAILQEANVLLVNPDDRRAHVLQWFWDQWIGSAPISESALRDAERKWALRTRFLADLEDTSRQELDLVSARYALSEEGLFKPAITGKNQIRMASSVMEDLFRAIEPKADNTMIRVPAFVSSILWTYCGRSIATAIDSRRQFQIPDHVWERALEAGQPQYNADRIQQFLSLLSTNAEAPAAVRYWAKKYIDAGCPGAP